MNMAPEGMKACRSETEGRIPRIGELLSPGFLLLSFMALLCPENAAAAGWRTDVAHSTVLDGNPLITEATYLDKGFLDTFEMSVGCRNSWPLPAFSFRLPAMTTDIMNPDTPAAVTFAYNFRDLERDPKTGNYRGGYRLPGLVRHGDYVFLPTGYNGISDVILTLLADLDTTDRKSVIIRFNQGAREWTYQLPLQGYRQAYQAALASCRDVKPRDGDVESHRVMVPPESSDPASGSPETELETERTAQNEPRSDAGEGGGDQSPESAPDREDEGAPPPAGNGDTPVTGVVLATDGSPEDAEKELLEEAAKTESGKKDGARSGEKKRLMNVSAGN